MYSKFVSMESIPRQKSAGCLSLKFGSIITAMVVILYSLIVLSQCFMSVMKGHAFDSLLSFVVTVLVTLVHGTSFVLSCFMMLGCLKEKASWLKPWVVFKSMQITGEVLMLLWLTVNTFVGFDGHALQTFILMFFALLLEFYMLVVVASYYKELSENIHEKVRLQKIDSNTWYTDV